MSVKQLDMSQLEPRQSNFTTASLRNAPVDMPDPQNKYVLKSCIPEPTVVTRTDFHP